MRKFLEVLVGVRSELLDATGLGLLASAAFTWSMTAGLVVAGVAVLAWNWRLEAGRE
ncbi:hypothetical protein ABZ612_16455 [Streptomyces avermitilis]|uniref:hypothetical protein n=1 Tax=Streptomyces TaxID=1883 RepID=UPI0033C6D0A9